jgi:hypothetical protein
MLNSKQISKKVKLSKIFTENVIYLHRTYIWSDIIDHLPNFMLISEKPFKKPIYDRPLIRLFSSKNFDKFCELLHNVEWDDLYNHDSVELCYKMFESKLKECFETCFPLIKLSRNRARDRKWFTQGLRVSLKHKNELYKRWSSTMNESNTSKYKTYRATFKKVLAGAKKRYYHEQFNVKSNSIKQLWANLNKTFSLSKGKSTSVISKITMNNVEFTEDHDICNCLKL